MIAAAHHKVVVRNAESLADKRKEVVGHCPVVHETAERTNLALLHLPADALHNVAFLVVEVDVRITRYLDAVAALYLVSGEYAREVRADNVVDEHDVELTLVLGQLDETRHLGIWYLHQGIVIVRHAATLVFLLTLLHHAYHQVQTAVADEGTDVARLNHHRREEREDLLVEKAAHKLLVERLGVAALIEIDVPAVELRQYLFGKDAVILLLLAVHLVGYLGEHPLGFGIALFRVVFLHNHPAVLCHANLVELFEVGRIDGEKFYPLVYWQRVVFRLQQHAIVERKPADVAFKVSVCVFHRILMFLVA